MANMKLLFIPANDQVNERKIIPKNCIRLDGDDEAIVGPRLNIHLCLNNEEFIVCSLHPSKERITRTSTL